MAQKLNNIPNLGQTQINIDPADCPDVECTYCGGKSFIQIMHLKAVSILRIPPNGGHFIENVLHCTNCQYELDLEKAKKWAFFSEEERGKARKQMLESLIENDKRRKEKKNGQKTDPPK